MPYVARNADGEFAGLFEQMQEGYAEEFLPDNNPEVAAFSERSHAALADDLQQKLERQELLPDAIRQG